MQPRMAKWNAIASSKSLLGLGVASAAMVLTPPASAQAQTIDIPAQSLASALQEFSRESGRELLFAPQIARGKSSQSVSCTCSPEAALTKMLSGTGLTFRITTRNAFLIEHDAAIEKAAAQDASSSQIGAEPGSTENGGTIIVTAQKRETLLTETPLAISAISQDVLDRSGAKDVRGLEEFVPGLIIAENGRTGSLQVSLRGIFSSNDTEFGAPAVGIHQDGVYMPRSQSAFTLIRDVERVEVVRGPQGTLFGKNSTVGTINLVSKRPELDDLSGQIAGGLGNYDAHEFSATLNVPIIPDILAIRLNYGLDKRDGWIDQLSDQTDFDGDGAVNVDQRFNRVVEEDDFYYNRDSEAFRVSAFLKPTDNFSIYAVYDKFLDDSAGALALKNCRLAAGTPGACASGEQFAPVLINVPGDHNVVDESYRLIADYAPFDFLELQYIFGAQDVNREQIVDVDAGQSRTNSWSGTFDGTGAPIFFDDFAQDRYLRWVDTFTEFRSHELQIKSPGDRRFDWILGGYYSREKGQVRQFNEEPNSFGFDTPSVINGPLVFNFQTDGIRITSKAVFGQVDFEIVPDLNITLGARYTEDRNAFDFQAAYSNTNPVDPSLYFDPVLAAPGDGGMWYEASDFQNATRGLDEYPIDSSSSDVNIKFDQTTWRLGIDYLARSLSDTFFYAYVATGYKAGNFDIPIPDTFVNFVPVSFTEFEADPEEVTTFEIGAKGSYLDDRLSLRLAFYYSDYENYQLFDFVNLTLNFQLQFPGGDPFTIFTVPIRPLVTQNIGSVEMYGIESEFTLKPWEDGQFSGNFVYADNEISDFNPVAFSQNWFCGIRDGRGDLTDCSPTSLEGNRLPRTPKFTANVNYRHSFEAGNWAIEPSVGLNYRSSFFHNITNFDEGEFSSRERSLLMLNANLRIAHADNGWSLDIWGRNLTDEQRMIGQNVGPAAAGSAGDLGFVVGEFTDPRTYGMRIRKTF